MTERERAIHICKNLTHTISKTNDVGIRSEFEWANSKARSKDLKKKKVQLMTKYDLKSKDLK